MLAELVVVVRAARVVRGPWISRYTPLVEQEDLLRELVERGFRFLRQLEGVTFKRTRSGERLLKTILPSRGHGLPGRGRARPGRLAELLDLLALLVDLARGGLLALLELLDLRLDRLDPLCSVLVCDSAIFLSMSVVVAQPTSDRGRRRGRGERVT
ncbi:MAG: hypothetical protein IPL89_04475 [Acidobacteria bacterium]|nr:hypothetical protein [Acidobacteriota bacterium]